MRQIEQVLIIVKRDMRTKELLMKHEANSKSTRSYFSGGLNALTYIKHVIEKLINEKE
jgi:hypothetical protein